MLLLKRDAIGENNQLTHHFHVFSWFLVTIIQNAADSYVITRTKCARHITLYDNGQILWEFAWLNVLEVLLNAKLLVIDADFLLFHWTELSWVAFTHLALFLLFFIHAVFLLVKILDQLRKHIVWFLFCNYVLAKTRHFKSIRIVVTVLYSVLISTLVTFINFAFLQGFFLYLWIKITCVAWMIVPDKTIHFPIVFSLVI